MAGSWDSDPSSSSKVGVGDRASRIVDFALIAKCSVEGLVLGLYLYIYTVLMFHGLSILCSIY